MQEVVIAFLSKVRTEIRSLGASCIRVMPFQVMVVVAYTHDEVAAHHIVANMLAD